MATLSERSSFDFITTENVSVDRQQMDEAIDQMLLDHNATQADADLDERIFRQAYIPKTLFEVVDPERDTGIVHEGGKNDLIYAKFLDVQETKSSPRPGPINDAVSSDDEEDSPVDIASDSDSDDDDEQQGKPRGKRHEDKDAKKVLLPRKFQTHLRNENKKPKKKPGNEEKQRFQRRKRRGK